MFQTIKIYNSLSRKKEILKPLRDHHVGLYACGITVYDDCHIGHAMQAIFFDIFRRFLEFSGYEVTYVRNYTDVDDKIINKAKELGISPKALSESIIKSSEEDMKALKVAKATVEPKVSDHMDEIIAMIKTLIQKGAAYITAEGDVYYRVRKKNDYGKLSGRKTDELRSGTRDITGGTKEDELDFALWKRDNTPDASWESPWSLGRPGWHIECSALSQKYLGNSFDIHGGGLDLKFPHHENEIAQSESANDCCYSTLWMHSGLLTIDKQKMSKSLGNHITIKKFLETWDAEVLRLSFLQNHYSSNIDFSNELFSLSRGRLYYYYQTLRGLDELSSRLNSKEKETAENFDDSLITAFRKAMSDDFNTSLAIGELNKFVKASNQALSKSSSVKPEEFYNKAHQIRVIGKVLGLFEESPESFIKKHNEELLKELGLTEKEIKKKIEERQEARENKNWALSDEIRDELLGKGILLKDSQEETTWVLSDRL